MTVADLLALDVFWPHGSDIQAHLVAPHTWLDHVGADGAAIELASLALWCVAVWSGIGLLAAAASALPGVLGRLSRECARRLLPAILLRVIVGTVGAGAVITTIGPAAAGAAAPRPSVTAAMRPTTDARMGAPPSAPGWPTDSAPVPRIDIGWPGMATAGPPSAGSASPPAQSSPAPPSRSSPAPPTWSAVSAAGNEVVVRPGDSLWMIAAHRLGPDAEDSAVAAAWPRWYAANRAVLGIDPGLITPGQVLHEPADPPH